MNRATYNKLIQIVVKERLALGEHPEAQRYIEERTAGLPSVKDDRRRAARVEVELPAVVMLHNEGNEFVCLPAQIKNISMSGVLLEIADKGHLYTDTLGRIERFIISFFVPGETAPVAIECQPKRLEMKYKLEVGAQFFRDELKSQRFLM